MTKILCISATLAFTLLFGSPARADFLGRAPGDYTIELLGSSGLCGGTNCVGLVHIPIDPVTTANFDWSFLSGSSVDFQWDDSLLVISSSPNGLNTCAMESSDISAVCEMFDDGFQIFTPPIGLSLVHQVVSTSIPTNRYALTLSEELLIGGEWVATAIAQVPEPSPLLLFWSALSALWFWRRATGRG